MENTVSEHMNIFLKELSSEMANFKILSYNQEKREMVTGNLFVDTISACLDGRQLSIPIRYTDKYFKEDTIFMWVSVIQDEKDGIRDEFGYNIELHIHKGQFKSSQHPNLSELYNEKHAKVFTNAVKNNNLPIKIFKVDEFDRTTNIYVPILDTDIETKQKNLAIKVLKDFYNGMNELAEQQKKSYEETIFKVTNDFRARAEEFIKQQKEEKQHNKLEPFNIEVEVYEENGKTKVFIADNGSSGCNYEVDTPQDVVEIVKEYIKNYKEN